MTSIAGDLPRPADARAYRVASLDIVRGLVLVIMALDHVRDFTMAGAAQDPMSDPNIGVALFFTRWITHFCAPVFVFLAGASAGLMSGRKSPAALGRFLLARGAWLIIVEWFVMSTAFTFSLHGLPQLGGRVLIALQVIWAIGASLIVLAGVQFAGKRPALLIGAAILLAHNLLDPIWPVTNPFDTSAPLWAGLHSQIGHVVGPYYVAAIYPLLPWTGVLLLGYGASPLFEGSADARRRRLLRWGLVLTLGFVALRLSGAYGDPNPWTTHPRLTATVIDVLNTTKYPPSLLFLLMTLGPAALFCAVADRMPAAVARPLETFGRVPFAFYVVHFYAVHAMAVALGAAQGFASAAVLHLRLLLPEGIRCAVARRVPRVGRARDGPVSPVPVGGPHQGPPRRLVAELRLTGSAGAENPCPRGRRGTPRPLLAARGDAPGRDGVRSRTLRRRRRILGLPDRLPASGSVAVRGGVRPSGRRTPAQCPEGCRSVSHLGVEG